MFLKTRPNKTWTFLSQPNVFYDLRLGQPQKCHCQFCGFLNVDTWYMLVHSKDGIGQVVSDWGRGVSPMSQLLCNLSSQLLFAEILSQVLSSPHNSPLLAAKYSGALFCFLLVEFFNTFGRCLDDLVWPTWSAIKVCRPTFTCQCHWSEYWFSSSPAACLTGWSLRSWSVFTSGGATVRNQSRQILTQNYPGFWSCFVLCKEFCLFRIATRLKTNKKLKF